MKEPTETLFVGICGLAGGTVVLLLFCSIMNYVGGFGFRLIW